MIKFAGIRRKAEFSPNHVVNDFLIINKTAEALQKLGAEVAMFDESIINEETIRERLIFSMAQGPIASEALKKIEKKNHSLIINSPHGVTNCYRTNMIELLPQHGIPFPHSLIVDTDVEADLEHFLQSPKIWVKRGDLHAVHKEDVALTYNHNECRTVLEEFHQRGIDKAVLQEHLEGDTVKFYALREENFFYWYYLNGIHHTPFSTDRLQELADASAEILHLYVYGGDAIIGVDRSITIIDINDWPSFAPVREEASLKIANLIFKKGVAYEKN